MSNKNKVEKLLRHKPSQMLSNDKQQQQQQLCVYNQNQYSAIRGRDHSF